MMFHLKVIGWLLVSLAFMHVAFPRYFRWKEDLQKLTLINKQMMEVHTFFIAFVVFLIGLLCLTSYDELIATELGRKICIGLAAFWGVRLVVQFVWYSSSLWKGKARETGVHILLSLLWVYLTCTFALIGFQLH